MTMTPDIRIAKPTGPANGATVTLLDTATMFGGVDLQSLGYRRATFSFPRMDQASAASGFIGYTSADKGTNWQQDTFAPTGDPMALPLTVAAATATGCDTIDVDITGHANVLFTFTAGATAPTVWDPVITLTASRASGY